MKPRPGPDSDTPYQSQLQALRESSAGTLISTRAWKYDRRPSYVVPGRFLGSDEHGCWIHQQAGAFISRPGIAFLAASDALLLLPFRGLWAATFYPERTYVDLACAITARQVPQDAVEVNLIDMDLDVERRAGLVELLDQDEFEQNRVAFGYPDELVAAVSGEADALLRGLDSPPFVGEAPAYWAEVARARAGHR